MGVDFNATLVNRSTFYDDATDEHNYSDTHLAKFELGRAHAFRKQGWYVDPCGSHELTEQMFEDWLRPFAKNNLWIDSVCQFIFREFRIKARDMSNDELLIEVSWG